MPVEQLRDLQLERMKKTVQHSYDNVAFYQRSFKEAGVEPGDLKTLEDLPKFPFVVKQDMRDAYPFGLFAVPQKDVARIHASSGTTGQATVVGHTANDLKNWGDCFARGIHMVNGNEDSTIQVSYGYGLFTGGLGAHYGGEAAGCTVIPTSSGNTKRQIQMMKDLGTDILACTPSYALLIADTAIEMGYDPAVDFKISAGIFGAEPASESMREDIRKKLGIQYCDVYGLSEVMPGRGHGVRGVARPACGGGSFLRRDRGSRYAQAPARRRVRRARVHHAHARVLPARALPHPRRHAHHPRGVRVRTHPPQDRPHRGAHRRHAHPARRERVPVPDRAGHRQLPGDRGAVPDHPHLEGPLDHVELDVETVPEFPFDEIRKLQDLKRRLAAELKSNLQIAVDIKIVEPKTIERSEGKAKRIIDLREGKKA